MDVVAHDRCPRHVSDYELGMTQVRHYPRPHRFLMNVTPQSLLDPLPERIEDPRAIWVSEYSLAQSDVMATKVADNILAES